jgi:hypothetical protein
MAEKKKLFSLASTTEREAEPEVVAATDVPAVKSAADVDAEIKAEAAARRENWSKADTEARTESARPAEAKKVETRDDGSWLITLLYFIGGLTFLIGFVAFIVVWVSAGNNWVDSSNDSSAFAVALPILIGTFFSGTIFLTLGGIVNRLDGIKKQQRKILEKLSGEKGNNPS